MPRMSPGSCFFPSCEMLIRLVIELYLFHTSELRFSSPLRYASFARSPLPSSENPPDNVTDVCAQCVR